MSMLERITARLDQQSLLMGGMMDRLRLDPADIARAASGTRIARAARTCMLCRSSTECRAWQQTVTNADEAPDFCPNRALFSLSRGSTVQ